MQNQRTLTIMIIATLTLLVSCGSGAATETTVGTKGCLEIGDVFELDSPGTYTAVATQSPAQLVTEVRGSHGEVLATSHPVAANTSAVDVRSGRALGLPPQQVFTVDSSVSIHVEHDADPYDLIVTRLGDEQSPTSPMTLRPVVERVTNKSPSCSNGQSVESFHIELDSVYSDLAARQAFIIEAPADRLD